MSKKKALIIGGSRGIGQAIVTAMAQDWQIAYTYANAPDAASSVPGFQADIRDATSITSAFDAAEALFGGPMNCVIVNAGINVPAAPVADFPVENFRMLVEVNLIGAFNALSEAARRVSNGGTITALTTALVRQPVAGTGPYTATKAAVEALLRSMQKELAPRNIRVNGVAPGPVDTELFRSGKDKAAIARAGNMSPFERVGTADEVAETVRFIVSDEASWIAGQILQPNGGMV
ncbi:SDR family oxidoreductase [Ahrensia kielensis]|uniref:SDR family oxidoreductase n=1 Tax=Ahrensia kielensis TaxID=76980 RepID=A0ABU9T2T2_9HYPH